MICVVCRELLATHPHHPENVDEASGISVSSADVVATKCGHLFHVICLNDWLVKQGDFHRQECPHCRSDVVTREFQRIFLSGDEDTKDLEERLKKEKDLAERVQTLQTEIQSIGNVLQNSWNQVEEKSLALDILSYEFDRIVGGVTGSHETHQQGQLQTDQNGTEVNDFDRDQETYAQVDSGSSTTVVEQVIEVDDSVESNQPEWTDWTGADTEHKNMQSEDERSIKYDKSEPTPAVPKRKRAFSM